MRRLTLVAGLALSACAAPTDTGAFRTAKAPIYSNASLDLGRLAGAWQQVATYGATGPDCPAGGAEFTATASGLTGQARLCIAGQVRDWSGPVTPAGPGRFAIGGAEPWWVLWIDADTRTLVIGTPTGAFGFVLDRDGQIPADRLVAAREILAFNGYDPDRLSRY